MGIVPIRKKIIRWKEATKERLIPSWSIVVLESIAEWLREASFVEVWNVEAVSQEHAFIVQPHIIWHC